MAEDTVRHCAAKVGSAAGAWRYFGKALKWGNGRRGRRQGWFVLFTLWMILHGRFQGFVSAEDKVPATHARIRTQNSCGHTDPCTQAHPWLEYQQHRLSTA